MNDRDWMNLALEEAKRGGWATHPNPMVGAVFVRDGMELGRGYHRGAGFPHAEIEAMRSAEQRGFDLKGSTIYVTLEPCDHFGRTPPCTKALIQAGIARCVIGTTDPDARVSGAGIARLEAAGIPCEVGLCQTELDLLNAPYFKRTRTGLPFVTAKWAMSADGHIATRTGHARWVSGEASRHDVHLARARHEAIMAGTQTVRLDNPMLNVRLEGEHRQPLRVILDRRLSLPLSMQVFDTSAQNTVLFTANQNACLTPYADLGVDIAHVPTIDDALDPEAILRTLVERYGITTLYCEGGARLHGALYDARLIDAVDIYIAPKLIGGLSAPSPMGGQGIAHMQSAALLSSLDILRLDDDIRLSGHLTYPQTAE
ncbi:MAG: bifunctional diaminohydroxyphosphoribosylaminopyrimidine deaminase/5-amino-6-(5-phosphoribosylamino)uracil reductase RibD [Proteobacteria bacterium]|nr:bifunctional diaminohydroxyphosphoribosylaminopyrimidine deaminase/5-amino-6-(5-phosphoribosylamino)uracil reductase RibD [Pseudomonadota bacterium]